MKINGDNNRVAANDYHEYNYNGPEPCPYCEQRYLTPGRQYCRHCEAEFEDAEQQRRNQEIDLRFALILIVAVFCIGAIFLLLFKFGPEEWQAGAALGMGGCFFVIVSILRKHQL
ncbi:prepilin peptidase [Photorhabdus laumondii]|uniref:prepilin peptidase n=1 Tax=Photorhabdus laumondii TaxID=2218628 RepID=UPI00031FE319|nr:prepilin peptidase [Photorhabdus laumondii]AWK43118.1 hypothetical protein A4R40_17210 [Photorhabdus laumondii subsp. laumondii]AXG48432.1 prepilin peptidase [Photorhabdus laumondii subsp. laumondii]KTL61618.1 hypothetical protein AA106_08145 [Photorhabdus laumondii subsp. laumondii]